MASSRTLQPAHCFACIGDWRIFRTAANSGVALVRAVSPGKMLPLVPALTSRVGPRKTLSVMAGSDAAMLAPLLEGLDAYKRQNMIWVMQHAPIDRLVAVLNSGVLPETMLQLLECLPPTDMIELIRGVPAATLGALLTSADVDALIALVRGVQPVKKLIDLVKGMDVNVMIEIMKSADRHRLVLLVTKAEEMERAAVLMKRVAPSSVLELLDRVDPRRLAALINRLDAVAMSEVVNKTPMDTLVPLVSTVDAETVAFLFERVPVQQMVKLTAKMPPDDLILLLKEVDSGVMADLASTTSARLLQRVLKVCHARAASKMLKLAPKACTKIMPAVQGVTFDDRAKMPRNTDDLDEAMADPSADSVKSISVSSRVRARWGVARRARRLEGIRRRSLSCFIGHSKEEESSPHFVNVRSTEHSLARADMLKMCGDNDDAEGIA